MAPLIEDTLRASLIRRGHVEQRGRGRLITIPGTGPRPGIDLDHSHSLLEIRER